MDEKTELIDQLKTERDEALAENCALINELLGNRYDVKKVWLLLYFMTFKRVLKLHETVQYMQHTINLLNNDSLRLKSRLDERDDLIHEKSQNVIYLESEVKKLKYEQDKIQKVTKTIHLLLKKNQIKQNEGYQLRFNRKIKEIDILREQINHYKSDMYKMQIAMPYADKIESLQMEVNNLKQSLSQNQSRPKHLPLMRTSRYF